MSLSHPAGPRQRGTFAQTAARAVQAITLLGAMGSATLAQAQAVSGTAAAVGTQRPPNIAYSAVATDGGSGVASAYASHQWEKLNPCPQCPIGVDPGEVHTYRYYSSDAWARAELTGTTSLPVLKGYAQGWIDSSAPGDVFGAWAQADAMQVYTYLGPSTTKQLQITVDAVLTGRDAGWAGAYLEVLVLDGDFVGSGGSFNGDVNVMRHFSTGTLGELDLLGAASAYAGYSQLTDTATIGLSLHNGDQFAVYARLSVGADAVSDWGRVEVDASHTARMRFDDAGGLTPQLMTTVPEPASAALLLAGLAGLGAWAARRRSRA